MCTHTEKHAYTSHTDKIKPNNNTNSEIQRRVNKSRNIQLVRQASKWPWTTLPPSLTLCVDSFSGKFPFSRCWRLKPEPWTGYASTYHQSASQLLCSFFFFKLFFLVIRVCLPHIHTKNWKKACRSQFLPSIMWSLGIRFKSSRHLQLMSHLNCAFLFETMSYATQAGL